MNNYKFSISIITLILFILFCGIWYTKEFRKYPKPEWSEKEKSIISSLWLGHLPELPPDPSNRVADNIDAAILGHRIFYDKRFSINGKVACSTCHHPDKYFTDGLKLSVGIAETRRNTPSIVATAYFPFNFWDGRVDSQWAQALDPLESIKEHGGSRTQFAHLISKDPEYRRLYENIFGSLPDLSNKNRFPDHASPVISKLQPDAAKNWSSMSEDDRNIITTIFVNIGKAIAAYERLITPAPSRFDEYTYSVIKQDKPNDNVLSRNEIDGLRLFIGKAKCIECHNGPLFTNNGFHNVAVPIIEGNSFDFGRSIGVHDVIKSNFNCMSEFSDANQNECIELRFIKRVGDDLVGSFKVPSLRNVTATAPYMHDGQFENLEDVVDHYNQAPTSTFGHSMLTKINLNKDEERQLVSFLHSLDSPLATDAKWLTPP